MSNKDKTKQVMTDKRRYLRYQFYSKEFYLKQNTFGFTQLWSVIKKYLGHYYYSELFAEM